MSEHGHGGRRQGRRVEGVIAEEKVAVMETCAVGWVKEVVSIRVLAKEIATAGLDGFEVMWVVGSMVLLAFLDADSRQCLLSQEEAELVRVPAVEHREVLAKEAMSEQSQEVNVASPRAESLVRWGGVTSPHWNTNQL
ncbi:hypothetical protein V6N12_067011 [Hibiscus sabdariffa]|uniref:Uncharacterized protein n=1 Tax=Hibiscus sabdariffa TaxID=183260 RepID=A0ABR2BKJ6_9ROSI